MRVKILDTAPGSGPARGTYLEARIRRVFEPFSARITAVELELEHVGVLHEGRLVVRIRGGAPLMFSTKGRRMTNVLANLIDVAGERLLAAFPSGRVREAAS